jgi:hypothetical protein
MTQQKQICDVGQFGQNKFCKCGHLKDHHLRTVIVGIPDAFTQDVLQCQCKVYDSDARKFMQCGCKI